MSGYTRTILAHSLTAMPLNFDTVLFAAYDKIHAIGESKSEVSFDMASWSKPYSFPILKGRNLATHRSELQSNFWVS